MKQETLFILNTMKDNHYSFESLADYADGKTNTTDQAAIEEHLADCEICQNILNGIKYYYTDESPSREELENYLDGFLLDQQEIIRAKQENPKVKTTANKTKIKSLPKPRRIWLQIAAILILGVCVLGVYRALVPSISPHQLAAQHLEEAYPVPTIRGGKVLEGENERWQEVVNAYQKKDYVHAASLIEKSIEADGGAGKRYFYLGLSYLQQDPPKAKEAIEPLKQVLASTNRYQEQALWYLALAYLGADQTELGKNILKMIVSQNTWKADEAVELLEEL